MDGVIKQSHFDLIKSKLDTARQAYLGEGAVSLDTRLDRLNRALELLFEYEDAFSIAISEDFTHRSENLTLFADIYASAEALKHAIKKTKSWMKPEKRPLKFPLGLLGASARLEPQPKGVVGLMTPWNFPLTMVFVPLAQMLAAGNRVMIKPSEFTPRTSALFAEAFAKYFDPAEVSVTNGDMEVSEAFSRQAFDHLMFTGSPAVGKHIMRAASENLVPVTLELGGKCPVVIGKDADIMVAAERIATMKMMNAGQICLSPDYVNVPASRHAEFIEAYQEKVTEMYPDLLANDDYTSVISATHKNRLENYLTDAEEKGADIRYINPADEDFSQANDTNKMAPAIVADVDDDMLIMQHEIFGPLLPVRCYDEIDDVIDYVNAHDRPLALYYFGTDEAEEETVLSRTTSGGVTVNDCLYHGGHETLPFGGVGHSGMGVYHGYDGFKEFSHMKPVLRHPKLSISKLLGIIPPYGSRLRKNVSRELGRTY